MKRWESLIDQRIREAMEQGEFEDLPGKGKPVDTSENPFEDPELRLAHRVLRNAGFAPSWIEERKDIEAEFEIARNQLAKAWTILKRARGSENESGAGVRWEQALNSFTKQVGELNGRIIAWNLKVPARVFQKRLINREAEINQIERADETHNGTN